MVSKRVKIGLVQMSMAKDTKQNIRKAVSMIKLAARKGANIICLPELYRTLYFPQDEKVGVSDLLEKQDGESSKVMGALAKELGVVLVVPIFEKGLDGKQYNTVLVIDADGKTKLAYRKMHIPHDPLFYEKNYFKDGNKGFLVCKTKFGKVAPLICFDQWFPEAARIAALNGADIIFYPTAIGDMVGYNAPDDWHDAWETVQRGHAIASGVHVAAVNRVGTERKLKFFGGSFICDSFGKILARGKDKEQVLLADVDFSNNERIKEGWGFIRNRRPDAYARLRQK